MPKQIKTSDQSKTKFAQSSKKIEDIFNNRKYIYALGRRKSAVALVKLYPKGKGRFYINEKDFRHYFNYFEFQKVMLAALDFLKMKQFYDALIKVKGGGPRGQSEAIRLGISRALIKVDLENKIQLRRVGFLTRDSRIKERKKPGFKSARRRPQFSKR